MSKKTFETVDVNKISENVKKGEVVFLCTENMTSHDIQKLKQEALKSEGFIVIDLSN